MSETLEIVLSSTLPETFIAVIDIVDVDLSQIKWHPLLKKRNCYASRRFVTNGESVTYLLHRVILGRILGRDLLKGELVDHRDGNGLNCRRDNLRLATHSQNNQNRRVNTRSKTGYKGVSWNKDDGLWVAQITSDGVPKRIGGFSNILDAARAYNAAALIYHGEFARLNVIPDEAQS